MACSSCGTGGSCGTNVGGCGSNGGCKSGGCTRMNSFDWLGIMEMDLADRYPVVEVKFKGGRKEYFNNPNHIELFTGDYVVVDSSPGYHIGTVSLQGELVRFQMKKKGITEGDEGLKSIQRKATEKDIEKFESAQNRESNTLYRSREIIQDLKLSMKLSDIEYQADNAKATFFYSADDRVDFRELIKLLASEFKIRVEMKQISLRQEAGRLGGIGSCGRELCCSTWLTDFKNVNTSAARYQNLALNPSKLSGQCGRLKCCLNYELDTYMEALKDIPEIEEPIITERGKAVLQKTDIFKKIMWFAYEDEITNWIPISVDRVFEILDMNARKQFPATLESNKMDLSVEISAMQREKEELSRFDNKFKKKKKKKKPSFRKDTEEKTDSNVDQGNTTDQNNRQRPQRQNRDQQGQRNKPKPRQNSVVDSEVKNNNEPVAQNENNSSGTDNNTPKKNNKKRRYYNKNKKGGNNRDNQA